MFVSVHARRAVASTVVSFAACVTSSPPSPPPPASAALSPPAAQASPSDADAEAAAMARMVELHKQRDARESVREAACKAGDAAVCRAIEEDRCPRECRAYREQLRAQPWLLGSIDTPPKSSDLVDDATTLSIYYWDGHNTNTMLEIQHVHDKTVFIQYCPDTFCAPASRSASPDCWARVATALERAHFWDAKELITSEERARRVSWLDLPSTTISGVNRGSHKEFKIPSYPGPGSSTWSTGDELIGELRKIENDCAGHPPQLGAPGYIHE